MTVSNKLQLSSTSFAQIKQYRVVDIVSKFREKSFQKSPISEILIRRLAKETKAYKCRSSFTHLCYQYYQLYSCSSNSRCRSCANQLNKCTQLSRYLALSRSRMQIINAIDRRETLFELNAKPLRNNQWRFYTLQHSRSVYT